MTLLIVAQKRHWSDPEGIKTLGGFGRQIEEISQYFKKTVLIVPMEERMNPEPGYRVRIENLEIVPLPYFDGSGLGGKLKFLAKIPQIFWRIWQTYQHIDVVHYRLPGYIGMIGLLIHKIRRQHPGFTWISTDWSDRIVQSRDTWYRRWMANFGEHLLSCLICDTSNFAVGHLAGRYQSRNPYTHRTITTVLSEERIVKNFHTETSSPVRLLYVGRLAVEKGLPFLLEAVKFCTQMGIDVKLDLIGDGPQFEQLEEIARMLEISDKIHFEGYVPLGDRLWEAYRQSDIFVFPSLSEGQPKVLIEAMAAGLPIIATRVGGIPSIIEDGWNGILVASHSSQALADAIQKLTSEPETLRQIASQASISATSYTIESQTEVLIKQALQDFQMQGW